ncbi:MAG: site-specific DNA-methyltransferase [Chloroflexota bacterium]|nr:site-specific DNA-methyltransferase [Chloroflexota bacterium]MDQ5865164.1 site-specific DNA-methyltransferase [Chloroflexota bacterium]
MADEHTGEHSIELPDALLNAVLSKSPPQGLTHTFYKYPARFSPEFARLAIRTFSNPGDVVLDPFMGSGTTLVEAAVSGRHAIGSDISPLARFIAEAKTTPLTNAECNQIDAWLLEIQPRLNLHLPARRHLEWAERGYQKGLPWPIRKTIEFVLWEIEKLPQPVLRKLARCALLGTGQWALDCTTHFPTASAFREKFISVLREYYSALGELREALANTPGEEQPSIVCLNVPAAELDSASWESSIRQRPSLVVTSPPYPKVHVLYHRWQIKGRRETPTPFWIAGELDGNGEAYYSMGSRSATGLNNYFRSIEESFTRIHTVLSEGAKVVQLVAFSDVDVQLPRYLQAMERAGFREINLHARGNDEVERRDSRVWRQVPLRRWYAAYKGPTSSSRELLMIHTRVP